MTVKPSRIHHLLGVQVFLSVARNVLRQSINLKSLAYGFEDNIFQKTRCVLAELA
jgi:hypothetical protein